MAHDDPPSNENQPSNINCFLCSFRMESKRKRRTSMKKKVLGRQESQRYLFIFIKFNDPGSRIIWIIPIFLRLARVIYNGNKKRTFRFNIGDFLKNISQFFLKNIWFFSIFCNHQLLFINHVKIHLVFSLFFLGNYSNRE